MVAGVFGVFNFSTPSSFSALAFSLSGLAISGLLGGEFYRTALCRLTAVRDGPCGLLTSRRGCVFSPAMRERGHFELSIGSECDSVITRIHPTGERTLSHFPYYRGMWEALKLRLQGHRVDVINDPDIAIL